MLVVGREMELASPKASFKDFSENLTKNYFLKIPQFHIFLFYAHGWTGYFIKKSSIYVICSIYKTNVCPLLINASHLSITNKIGQRKILVKITCELIMFFFRAKFD